MKIKIVSFGVAALIFAGSVHAQSGAYIKGGLNLANVSVTDNGRVDDANGLTSYQVGVVGNIQLGKSLLYLQPGLVYTGKGSKVQKGTAGQAGYFKQTFNPKYVEIPLNVVVKLPISKTGKFFAGAGPYAAIGVSGKTKTEGTRALLGDYNFERDITFSDDDPTTFNEEEGTGLGVVRRFDYGVNGTVGLEGKNLVLGIGYGIGLAKLQSGTNSGADNNNKHRVASVTLGFKF